MFSLIGTAFLWIYWPSFVAGAAVADSEQQQRAIVNTIMALSASTVVTFCLTSLLSNNGRMRPVDIQNATLAGGVAIGCTANLTMSVFGAVMIGVTAGAVSTIGYNILQPYLEKRLGLHDTCGVHNLHAMPSVVGALASVILAGYKGTDNHDLAIYGENISSQWWRQLVAIPLCMSFAIIAGLLVGKLLLAVESKEEGGVEQFHDRAYWEVAEDYGRSLYSELSLLVQGGDSKHNAVDLFGMHMSSHHGRRRPPSSPDSLEGSLHKSTSSGRDLNPTLSAIISDLSGHGGRLGGSLHRDVKVAERSGHGARRTITIAEEDETKV